MQVNDELRVLVEAEVARAIDNFKKLDDSIGSTEGTTKSLGEALDSLSKKSVFVSAAIGGAGIAAVKLAGENEKLKLSLTHMLGSAEEASAVFEEWRRLGNSPGLSTNEVFELGRAMVNMGQDTASATKTIQMLGDIAAGTGKSFGTVSSAFERVRAQGKLSTRDLSSLQQQGIPILKQLAAELNTSEEGIRRMVAEGKVGFPELERAFISMTEPGGQFAGMMDELSGTTLEKFSTAMDDAKQALASFGELLLPLATELLDNASSLLRGITEMDEGTKRFVIGMGSVVAVSGPAISAIKGIGAAMTALAANPYMLAIGGAVAGTAALVGYINKQTHAYEDLNTQIRKTKTEADSLLRSYADGNDAKTLDKETTEALIRLYPDLAGEITAYTTTVNEAAAAVKQLTEIEVTNAALKRIEKLRKETEAAEDLEAAYERYHITALKNIEIAEKMGDALGAQGFRDAIETYKYGWDEAAQKAERTRRQINAELAKIGKVLGGDFSIIDIPVSITVDESALETMPSLEIKKRWQDWYGEITKIDPDLFGSSGAKAAELYLGEFSRSFEASKTVFASLGEELDITGLLRGQQDEIQKALVDLFSINPADINNPFEIVSEPIESLIAGYKRLGEAAKEAGEAQKAAAARKDYAQHIEDLQKRIEDFGKSESQLAYEAAIANGALESQAEEVKKLMDEYSRLEILSEYRRQVESLTADKYELARASLSAAGASREELAQLEEYIEKLQEADFSLFKEAKASIVDWQTVLADKLSLALMDIEDFSSEAAIILGDLNAQFVELAASSALTGFEEFGRALGEAREDSNALSEALAAMSQQILNQLPTMFLQAGLQLIANGQWPLGLGFIAAAGSSALISGYVGGKSNAAQQNASGGVYDEFGRAARAFASGGTFTNQIINSPTYFRHGGGLGLMGEAGPEAILPLKRMSSGNLGVEADGSNTQVIVNIINNSGAEVSQEEKTDDDGNKQIDVIIGPLINSHISSGKADRTLSSRYGLRATGV